MTEHPAQDHAQGAIDAFRAVVAVISLFRRDADPTEWPDGFEFTLKTLEQCLTIASYHMEQAFKGRSTQ